MAIRLKCHGTSETESQFEPQVKKICHPLLLQIPTTMTSMDSNSSNDQDVDQLELMGASNEINATQFDLSKLPDSFQRFLKDNSIDPQIYTVATLPRYIRTNTHLPKDKRPSLQDLKTQFQTDKVYAVDGLDHFFSVQLDDTTQRISDVAA